MGTVNRTIELPENVYQGLERAARERGMTTADWIASILPNDQDASEQQRLHKVLNDLVGVIDSSKEPRRGHAPTPFADLVSEKLEKQGLRRP
jgi:hypothetical protein